MTEKTVELLAQVLALEIAGYRKTGWSPEALAAAGEDLLHYWCQTFRKEPPDGSGINDLDLLVAEVNGKGLTQTIYFGDYYAGGH